MGPTWGHRGTPRGQRLVETVLGREGEGRANLGLGTGLGPHGPRTHSPHSLGQTCQLQDSASLSPPQRGLPGATLEQNKGRVGLPNAWRTLSQMLGMPGKAARVGLCWPVTQCTGEGPPTDPQHLLPGVSQKAR